MPQEHTTIGRYEIRRVLGRGAMGVVYLAEDPLLKRPVAIKVVHNSAEDQGITLERFRREAEISAKLTHPNIVMVFDVGEDPAVGPFLAMEYVEGVSLAQLVTQGLPVETSLYFLIQGMSALQAAEAAGIVHRDIKPDNMLVSKEGRLKLMDFGIARRDESRLTQAGMIFGTPTYTAPELLVGAEATPATDQYALFVTAFEMLTGDVPYTGSSVANTLYRIVHHPPQFPADIDPALKKVFLKALEKEPRHRYPDIPSFLGGLLEAVSLSEESRARLRTLLNDGSASTSAPFSFLAPELGRPTGGRRTTAESPVGLGTQSSTAPDVLLSNTLRSERGSLNFWKSRLQWKPWKTWVGAGTLLVIALTIGSCVFFGTPEPRYVDIASTPTGAAVLLNGRYIGKTPLYRVPTRAHGNLIRLELAGHQALTRQLAPEEWSVHVVLVKPPFTIPVETDPAGADVFLNNRRVGTTPIDNLPVPREGHPELRIHKKGYQEWRAIPDENIPFPAPIRLSPSFGTLRVITEPAGAEVLLDGLSVGSTPMMELELSRRGLMNVELKLNGYKTWRSRVSIKQPLPDPIVLEPEKGN